MGRFKILYFVFLFILITFVSLQAEAQSVHKADSLQRAGKYQEAIQVLKQLAAANPDNATYAAQLKEARKKQEDAEKGYNEALQNGLQYFNEKDYAQAKEAFKTALGYKPHAAYPNLKLQEIQRLYKDPEEEKAFDNAINRADELMNDYKYEEALTWYNKALELKPRNVEVLKKVKQINSFIAKQESRGKDYDQALDNAAKLFAEGYYKRAMLQYQEAALIKPDKSLPKNKIEQIRNLLQGKRQTQQQYELKVATADSLYMQKQFEKAKKAYQAALEIKPSETYPVNMLSKIDPALARKEQLNSEYLKLIEQADLAFKIKDYDEAQSLYQTAQEVNPASTYPADKIDEIKSIVQTKSQNYEGYIADGDRLLESEQLAEARVAYEQAAAIYPGKDYARQQIATIDDRLAADAEKNERYEETIAKADSLFAAEQYATAVGSYQSAATLFPAKPYPARRIAEIKNLQSSMEEKQQRYDQLIATADSIYAEDLLVDALQDYKEAATIMPEQEYPERQIQVINRTLERQQERESKYYALIGKADKKLQNNDLTQAKTLYAEAATAFADSAYPKNQIQKIDNRIAQKETDKAQQERLELYQQMITEADEALQNNNLTEAKELYVNAINAFADSAYPNNQIQKIDNRIAQRKADMEQQQRMDKYQQMIGVADEAFENENLTKAKTLYAEAASDFADSSYPNNQIQKIDNRIAQRKADMEQQQRMEKYQQMIGVADEAFENDSLAQAKMLYAKAASSFADSAYPKNQIQKIDNRIAQRNADLEQQQRLEKYQQMIGVADEAFENDSLAQAKTLYAKAASDFADSAYPKNQIQKIDNRIAERKARREKYAQLLAQAKQSFDEESYNEALSLYQDAAKLMPDNPFPEERISVINDTLARIESRELAYEKAIQKGDSLYQVENYQQAIASYQEGQKLYPDRSYAEEQISKSMDLLAAIREQEKMYARAIAAADSLFEAKKYTDAIISYEDALAQKQGNTYAQQQIAAAQDSIKEREEAFNYAMAQGNKRFEAEEYKQALTQFEKALALKPENESARNRVNETRKILEQLRQKMLEEYQAIIAEADKLYESRALSRATNKYEAAAKVNPEAEYPEQMIQKIKDYLAEHALREIVNQSVTVKGQSEQVFEFQPLAYLDRSNNFIVLTTKGTKSNTKIFLNYGQDDEKQGGVVIPSIPTENPRQFIFNLSDHRQWKENDINWISVYVQGADITISNLGVSKGD